MACVPGTRKATEAAVAVGDGLAPRTRPGGVGPLDGARRGERPGGDRDGQTTRADASGAQTHRNRRVAGGHTVSPRDAGTLEGHASPDARDQDARYGYRYYLTPTCVANGALEEPSLGELARVITAGTCIEASFQRGKGEVGMDEYQVRTWEGWYHHKALTLIAVWFLIGETH